jgi:membrane-bound lytic murein transglycosylase D
MTDPTPPGGRPTESGFLDRYFGDETPADMSRRTALIRRRVTRDRRRFNRYRTGLLVVGVLAVLVFVYGYVQHRRVARARALAGDLFYSMKALELEVARLQLSAAERSAYDARRGELARRYHAYLEDLGVYGPTTPEDVQTIYRVVHRLGESEINVPREFVDEVRRVIRRWRDTPRLTTALSRAREHEYGPRITSILLAHDLPPELFYLALQESEFRGDAVGRPTRFGIAKGMWQFMPETARAYGLTVGPLVGHPLPDPADDRHDFEKATAAAARYLRDIYATDAQASGLLVIAAYNWGQTRVLRLIRSLPESPRERNYWRLLTTYRDRIPDETYNYVLAVVSAAAIGDRPDLFGFVFDPPLRPLQEPGPAVTSAP